MGQNVLKIVTVCRDGSS